MRFISRTPEDGVIAQDFLLDELPGVLWTPGGRTGSRPLILLGHGGGQHKRAPGVVALARRLVREGGFAVVTVDAPAHGDRPRTPEHERAIARMRDGGGVAALHALHALLAAQSVPEWRAVLDALGVESAGYLGMSLGCALGIPFVAAEPRVRAAVLGLLGGPAEEAARITVPVEFWVQWDDQLVPRADALALFDRIGSAEKSLHANPGGHGGVPAFEADGAVRFFTRHLG